MIQKRKLIEIQYPRLILYFLIMQLLYKIFILVITSSLSSEASPISPSSLEEKERKVPIIQGDRGEGI